MIKLKEILEYSASDEDDMVCISGDGLKQIAPLLLKLKEFEGVKEFNVLPLPIYHVDKETNLPIEFSEDYIGGDVKVETVVSVKMELDKPVFNETIDILSLNLSPKIYDPKDIEGKIGVWRFPTVYNPKSFSPYSKIEVIWSPENSATANVTEDELKARLMKQFEEALTSEPNVPYTRDVMVRCSERSYKFQKEEKE